MFGVGDGSDTILYSDGVTRDTDDAFDQENIFVVWRAEYDNVASMGVAEPVGELINDQVVFVGECWNHGGTGDDERLGDDSTDYDDDGDDQNTETEEVAKVMYEVVEGAF